MLHFSKNQSFGLTFKINLVIFIKVCFGLGNTENQTETEEIGNRILKGNDCLIKDYPYLASYQYYHYFKYIFTL